MIKRSLLTLALIASAGTAYAQTNTPLDPYGRPLLGRNDWVRQPGDQPGPAGAGMAAPAGNDMAAMPMNSGPRQPALRDEFGNRYDAQGNRIDARGNIMPPPRTPQ